MKFRIKNRKDGTFDCLMESGRKITGEFFGHPGKLTPSGLSLFAIVNDPTGQPRRVVSFFDVPGYLNSAQLQQIAHNLERRAEGVERGEPTPPDSERFDFPEPVGKS
jgi:hypothetical protein